ncbi:transcriptional regulatory protein DIP1378-like protein [Euroglyphus maynei]|uniref:Transcriptional regulatory protein DIP1378-like protein n=1 Tax=Euroglyphus maynei TaxID=6958 RepID=A0A1Y3AXW3_EURMA|nr:transcriptional regulatory protein DIP1378-like protein [Euroglyphus maynei]
MLPFNQIIHHLYGRGSCLLYRSSSTVLFHHHQQRLFHLTPVFCAGHSKWQNIKHVKASKDQQKSQLFNRLIAKIRTAVQKQGGADPNLNREFGDVIQECRKANMPNSTIEKAVKRSLEKKLFQMKLEIIGPEGSLLVVDAEVDNKNFFRNEVRKILKKKIGFGFADDGRALSLFEEKGVVRVKNIKNDSNFDLEKAEEIAIEADAEEVHIDEQDDTILMFIGDQYSNTRVKSHIEKNYSDQFVVIENSVELIPYVRTEISEQSFQQVVEAINEIGELEGVNRVYNNI